MVAIAFKAQNQPVSTIQACYFQLDQTPCGDLAVSQGSPQNPSQPNTTPKPEESPKTLTRQKHPSKKRKIMQQNFATQNPKSPPSFIQRAFQQDHNQPIGSTNGPVRQRDQESHKDPRTQNSAIRPHQPRRHRPTNRPQPNTQTPPTNTSSQHRTRPTLQQHHRNTPPPILPSPRRNNRKPRTSRPRLPRTTNSQPL